LRAKGQQKKFFIKAGKDKNFNFGLGAGGGLFLYFQQERFSHGFSSEKRCVQGGQSRGKTRIVWLVIQ
jgi:hypothetical protein